LFLEDKENLMVKVCHMTSVHKRYDTRIFQKMCRSLAKNGYDVTLLVMDDLPEETKDGVRIISVPFKPKNRLDRIMNSGGKLLKKAVELDCDLYHFHDPELLPIGLRLKKLGKKVIYDSHEDYSRQIIGKSWIPGKITRLFLSRCFHFYETCICRKLDAVIFPCTVNGQNIFANRSRHCALIGNMPILQMIPNQSACVKKEKQICLTGSLAEARGVTQLVKAMEFCDGILVMAGAIPEKYLAYLQTLPGWEKVDFRGRVSFEEAQKIIGQSCVGTSVLRNTLQYNCIDTLATKIYEYMNFGIPVVMNDAPYNRSQNNRLNFGICVDPDSPEKIAAALNHLLAHPDTAEAMGRNGRHAVEREFNWSVEEKKLLELYAALDIKKQDK